MDLFYRHFLRPAYYVFIRGMIGAVLIVLGPGLVLQLFTSEKFVARLMDGAAGQALVILAVLWFASQFYKGMKSPEPMQRPRAT